MIGEKFNVVRIDYANHVTDSAMTIYNVTLEDVFFCIVQRT
jgi:hypothetical protein